MAGHSKRHNIKHKKAATDAKKAKVYSKVGKLIEIAARGGANPSMNPALETVLQKARYNGLPKDVIEKAIKKWSWSSDWKSFTEMYYEWYGPWGSALYIKVLTDNPARTTPNIRSLLSKAGGSMAEMWAVSWNFSELGEIVASGVQKVEKIKWNDIESIIPFDNDELEMFLMDCDVMDYNIEEWICTITTSKENFVGVRNAIAEKRYAITSADLVQKPNSSIELSDMDMEKLEKIIELLEDDDDVENVYVNLS
jgi:YebC/PmpR family DNA-binding regulatory protein